MDRKRDTDLIILEVLDCQELSDKKNLQYLKENDESFSWKELAKYQNLSAVLPAVLEINKPSEFAKEVVVKKLNRIIFGKEDLNQTEKFPSKKIGDTTEVEKTLSNNKIDWSSISVSEKTSDKLSGFEEVKSKTDVLRKGSGYLKKFEDDSIDEDTVFENESNIFETDETKKSKGLRKYILTSILLFIVIISISVYLLFYSGQESKVIAELDNTIDTTIAEITEAVPDSSTEIILSEETKPILQEEVISKPETEEKIILKEPPRLPEQIIAPLTIAKEVIDNEEIKIEEEVSLPPKEEVVKETEQQTFFVAVEEMPQPIGGLKGIQEKIKYPEIAIKARVEGKVFIKAFVDEDGNVVNAEIVKGIGAGCDEEALDAVMKTRFIPGKQRGKPVKVQVTVPVLFKL